MIASSRYLFVGAHVTEPVKEALRAEAGKRSISVSLLIFKLLVAGLKKLGYGLED